MKKILLFIIAIGLLAAAFIAFRIFGHGTPFNENKKYLYVYTGKSNKEAVLKSIEEDDLLKHPGLFEWVAGRMNVWERLKPGRYEIKKGESIFGLARILRNNRQTPVNLVINKLRTNEDLIAVIAKNFESDSSEVVSFINNSDSLSKLDVTHNTLMTLVIPNSYTINWSSSPGKVLRRLRSEQQSFWEKNNRKSKAQELGLTLVQVYTIASIVEEETNKNDEKGNVASVYINRYRSGMPLGADPTIKFALKDFSLKRIYHKHLQVESPYNTYKVPGLPPGPICTASPKTIDAVLNAPKTNYMYFVARSDFSGYHTFSNNYAEHLQRAKEYQKALDELIIRKQNAANNGK